MDIPALSMALSQNKILNDVGVAVLAKSLDTMESAGEALVSTIDSAAELSVNPNVGANIDIRI
ncbi:YjfB family protein [Butyrivibrio proteoclasticus]|uniref:YjfB family protein n=1 Tax=Butyrivibrio proteoclasticus TaxID=43305 RepID=UPI00047E4C42|nr:YjfB family protein [Butyrivibrio proteoclasticus]